MKSSTNYNQAAPNRRDRISWKKYEYAGLVKEQDSTQITKIQYKSSAQQAKIQNKSNQQTKIQNKFTQQTKIQHKKRNITDIQTYQIMAIILTTTQKTSTAYLYEQLEKNQLSPRNSDDLYQRKFQFVREFITFLQYCIESMLKTKINKIPRLSIRSLTSIIFNCRKALSDEHSKTVINLIKTFYDIQFIQISLDELFKLHQILSDIALKKRNHYVNHQLYRNYMLEQKRHAGGRAQKYQSTIRKICTVWTKKHTQLLKKMYFQKCPPEKITSMFHDYFPENRQLWNEEGLIFQWQRITKLALKALQRQINRNQDIKYTPLPVMDNLFVTYLTRNATNLQIQLNMMTIMDKISSSDFIEITIKMINEARQRFEEKKRRLQEEKGSNDNILS